MAKMDSKPQSRKRNGWVVALVAVLVLSPVLYVLSSGPAYWLAHRKSPPGHFTDLTTFRKIYAPLYWARGERRTYYPDLWDRYLAYWVPAESWKTVSPEEFP